MEPYRFGAIEIRPAERVVTVDGRPAPLGSRAFDVLLALVERRDRVVTKNELLDLAWPGLVVEENNLQAQVSSLRRALGPRVIATIPGRGYRFAMAEGGAPSHAASASCAARSTSDLRRGLPSLAAPLIGRDDELAAIDRLLDQHRLVTIGGAAGIGKTSIVIAAAEQRLPRMRDGVVWADLAPISDAGLVPAVLAKALQVQAAPGSDVTLPLLAALRELSALVVIDNAEHVLAAVARLADAILSQAPGITILVTSRAALKLKSERLMRLGPLGVPEPGVPLEEARTYGAIALLEERARAANARFELNDENIGLAVEICRHLDGIALAIELAAARVPLLGMRGLAERIGQRFRLLASSSPVVPTRQQTLLAALDWSHELLSQEEQKVFRRLGVFAGDFPVELATAVVRDEAIDEWAAIDSLGALVDRSLVEVDTGVVPRYRLLESARAYALLKMSAEETRATQRALAAAMLRMFERAQEEWWSWVERDWFAAYGAELENMRAALDWSMEHDPPLAIALLGASSALHGVHGLEFELRQRCERLVAHAPGRVDPATEGRYWLAFAHAARGMNRDKALSSARRAAELFRHAGDERMRFMALVMEATRLSGAEADAVAAQFTAIERPEWPARMKYWGAISHATAHARNGRDAQADVLFDRALEHAHASGSELLVSRCIGNIADRALMSGDVEKAVRLGRELMRAIPERHYHAVVTRAKFGNALLRAGDIREARSVIASWIRMSRALEWETFPTFAPLLAYFAASEERFESAARLLGYAAVAGERMGGDPEPNEQKALDLATAAVQARLGDDARKRLMAEGARLDEEAVCALALEAALKAPAGPPRPASRRRLSA
jgi:predicted ATPase/DNA-binding winged helix-turn-helix (wHTH) protein